MASDLGDTITLRTTLCRDYSDVCRRQNACRTSKESNSTEIAQFWIENAAHVSLLARFQFSGNSIVMHLWLRSRQGSRSRPASRISVAVCTMWHHVGNERGGRNAVGQDMRSQHVGSLLVCECGVWGVRICRPVISHSVSLIFLIFLIFVPAAFSVYSLIRCTRYVDTLFITLSCVCISETCLP